MNRITAPDGTPLVYDAYELPANIAPSIAVLFLHDWADDAARWKETGARLRDAGYNAYFLDQRGHGRSGGRSAHLSRFSQLLGDLQSFRRAVRRLHDVPQVICGVGFGGLVVLRYLETQPGDRPAAAVVANPWLASRRPPAVWKRLAARLADLWPTLPTGMGAERMTAGARAEIQWAQRAVQADAARIETLTLFLLASEDRRVDARLAGRFAERLARQPVVRWYAALPHELLHVEEVLRDALAFVATAPSLGADPKNE